MDNKFEKAMGKIMKKWAKKARKHEGKKYDFEDNLASVLHLVACQMYDKGWNENSKYNYDGKTNDNSLEEIEEMERTTLDEVLQEMHIRDARVTRVEVIDSTGRAYVNMNVESAQLSYQDNSKTLKIFIK